MKKVLVLVAALISGLMGMSQSTPNNLDLGLFNNGANGSDGGTVARLAISLRVKPGGVGYAATPVADDFLVYLRAPMAAGFDINDQVEVIQHNGAIYGTNTMIYGGSTDQVGDGFMYWVVALNLTNGLNLSSLNPTTNAWSFAFTFRFSNPKTPSQYSQVRIVDDNNNTALETFFGAPGTRSYLFVQSTQQLTAGALTVLPVNLLNFSGYKSGSKNVLKWTTLSEENNAGFDVLRSVDGVNYSSIGWVETAAPGGISNSALSYTFDDNSPVGRKQYYKLRQKDIDGRTKLSNVVMITGDKPTLLTIGGLFPNPASSLVNIVIDAPQRDNITLVVMDVSGKTVKQQIANVETGSNTIAVDISNLAQGSYLVKVLCQSDCESTVAKFNKQ